MRKLFKERKLFKGGNYMRKYGMLERRFQTQFVTEITHRIKGSQMQVKRFSHLFRSLRYEFYLKFE